jgi:hypothetical protein
MSVLISKLLELYVAKNFQGHHLRLGEDARPDRPRRFSRRHRWTADRSPRSLPPAIEAIRGQTLATIEERHRATPCSGPALAPLQRASGKDDRALKGSLCEDDSPASTPAADAKFAAGHAGVTSEGRKVF